MSADTPGTWSESHYVTAYRLARGGMTDHAIADALGTSSQSLSRWRAQRPAFSEAIERGRAESRGPDDGSTFADYVYKQLPEDVQDLWDEIMAAERDRNDITRIERLLSHSGKRSRQWLFIHALIHTAFNISEALRLVRIPKRTLESWKIDEPEFGELIEEMIFHKKNFFEAALMDLVAAREPSAVIFVAKTFNADRGYGAQKVVHHRGAVNHDHTHTHDHEHKHLHAVLPVRDLPIEQRLALLKHAQTNGVKPPGAPQ